MPSDFEQSFFHPVIVQKDDGFKTRVKFFATNLQRIFCNEFLQRIFCNKNQQHQVSFLSFTELNADTYLNCTFYRFFCSRNFQVRDICIAI